MNHNHRPQGIPQNRFSKQTLSSLSLMKCNATSEDVPRKMKEGAISNWHGATLLNGGYIQISPKEDYRKFKAFYMCKSNGCSQTKLSFIS
jgi:hypothetical protein